MVHLTSLFSQIHYYRIIIEMLEKALSFTLSFYRSQIHYFQYNTVFNLCSFTRAYSVYFAESNEQNTTYS